MITEYLIPYSILSLAAVCNALMDSTGDIVEFNRSVFRFSNDKFWCKEISWQYAKKVLGWKADAWHISKSIMLLCFALFTVLFKSTGLWYADITVIGSVWILVFNLFYNKLFRK